MAHIKKVVMLDGGVIPESTIAAPVLEEPVSTPLQPEHPTLPVHHPDVDHDVHDLHHED